MTLPCSDCRTAQECLAQRDCLTPSIERAACDLRAALVAVNEATALLRERGRRLAAAVTLDRATRLP